MWRVGVWGGGKREANAHLYTAHCLVDAPDLLWVEPTRDVHHTNSAANELQHGLPLQESCGSDICVQSQP